MASKFKSDYSELRELYESGMPVKDIGSHYGVCTKTIFNNLKRQGFTADRKISRMPNWDVIERDVAAGMSYAEASRRHGVNAVTIGSHFIKKGYRKDIMALQNIQPLTEQEKKHAEKWHQIIYTFLNQKSLPDDMYYDVAVFGYIKAVKKWFARPDLHSYNFMTIAFYDMWRVIGEHHKKIARRYRKAQMVSLDQPVNGSNDLTLSDAIRDPRVDIEQQICDREAIEEYLASRHIKCG